MCPPDEAGRDAKGSDGVECAACASALRSAARRTTGVLLLDHLTLPVVGCDDHREAFASICARTADGSAEVLDHRPAGGIPCPSCQVAVRSPEHPVVPVGDGAVAVLACPEHRSAVVDLFRRGLEARYGLSSARGQR